MDKQEYREFLDEIKRGFESGDYERVASYADEIELGKIKEPRILDMISDSYSHLGEYDMAIEALLKARDRNSSSRQTAYKLSELSVMTGDLDSAVKYYEDYCRLAGDDSKRYILKYEIGRAGDIPAKELIKVLEAYNSREKDERWEYELARLYHEAGDERKCVETCDDIFLWYADGEYVKKALELKFSHVSLTPIQQQKYEEMMSDYIDPKPSWYQDQETEEAGYEEPEQAEEKYDVTPEENGQIDTASHTVSESSPEIDETQVIPVKDILDQIEKESGNAPEEAVEADAQPVESADDKVSYTAVWASAVIRASEQEEAPDSQEEAEIQDADVPEEETDTDTFTDEADAAYEAVDIPADIVEETPAQSSKSSSITFDELRKMIHEGNSKKAAQGVFFTMEEPTEEDIAEEAAMKAARIAAEEEAARLEEEAERIAAEEEAARQAAEEEARLAAQIEAARRAEEEAARAEAEEAEDRQAEKAAQIAELEQASSQLMAAARQASEEADDEDDETELMTEAENEIPADAEPEQNIDSDEAESAGDAESYEDYADEEGKTRIVMKKSEVREMIEEDEQTDAEFEQAAEDMEDAVQAADEVAEISPSYSKLRRQKLKKIRNQNTDDPQLDETQFINRKELMEKLFSEDESAAEAEAEEESETPEQNIQDEESLGATQIFSRKDILKDTVLSTVDDARDSHGADVREKLGAAIEEILQDADAVLEVSSEETKTIRIVLSAASAAKLGITSAMLSPLADEVAKPDLVYISPDSKESQAIVDAINSEFGTPRIIDNVDFSYIGLSRDEDGQMGINLDFLVRDDDNIEGQITFFDVFDSYNERLEKNKDEVAAIEAERLRQIQEAVNLTAPIKLPYAMEDMELDDIIITDLEGNEQIEEPEELELNLDDISLIEAVKEADGQENEEVATMGIEEISRQLAAEVADEPLEIPPWKRAALEAESEEASDVPEMPVQNEEPEEELEIPPWKKAALEAEAAQDMQETQVQDVEEDDDIEIDITETGSIPVEEIIRGFEHEKTAEADAEDAEPEEELEIPPWKKAALEAEAAALAASETMENAEPETTESEDHDEILEETDEISEGSETVTEAEDADVQTAEPESEEAAVAEEDTSVGNEAQSEDDAPVQYEIPTWKIAQIMDAEAAMKQEEAQAEETTEAAEEIAESMSEEETGETETQPESADKETAEDDADAAETSEVTEPDEATETEAEAEVTEEAVAEAAVDTEPEEEYEIPPWKKAALEAEAALAASGVAISDVTAQESADSIENEEDAASAAIAEFEKHYSEVMSAGQDDPGLNELGDSLAELMGTGEEESELTDAEKAIAAFEKTLQNEEAESGTEEKIEGFDELGDSLANLMESAEPEAEAESVAEAETEPEAEPEAEPEQKADPATEPEIEQKEPEEEIDKEQTTAQTESTEISGTEGYTLPDDIREEMSEFLLIEGMEDAITETVSDIIDRKRAGDATGGNLIITGDIKSGKTFLSIAVIKAVAEELQLGNGKVAKVQAELLNGKNMEKVFNKISGSDLIIENVGYLEDNTIEDIIDVMETGNYNSMIVFEGNQLAVENILSNFPELRKLFSNRIDINELSIVQWADVAIEYADEKGYVLDDMAKLALHAKINEINVPTARLGYDNIIEIMDRAIEKAEKRNVGKLFAAFSSKKNANEKREIVESDII